MDLIRYEVNLYEAYVNRPRLQLHVTGAPNRSELKYSVAEAVSGSKVYYAERDGLVSFFVSTDDHHGFGGQIFKLPMVDGSEVELIGPWSSRPGCVNKYFGPCVDADVFDENSDRVANNVTVAWLEANGITMKQYLDYGETTYEPVNAKGEFLK